MYRNINSMSNEMNRMRHEMNKLFRQVSSPSFSAPGGYPAVNTWADKDKMIVTAELPGIVEKDLDISIEGNTLTISGERKAMELPEAAVYHRQERGCGKFTRVITLPYQIDSDKVSAEMKSGILEINLERAEADKPRKIIVKKG